MPSLGTFTPPSIPGISWSTCCSACANTHCIIPGDGLIPPPVPSRRILAIGERPGADEYRRSGRPFTGKSGQELNENYLYLAGLSRDEIYLCNTVRCGAEGNKAPTAREAKACARHFLPYELDSIRPHFVLLLGGTACSLFDDAPEGPIVLALHHGRPLRRTLYGRTYWVIPMYHPALGMHDTRQMTPLLEDWETAGKVIRGEWRIPVDEHKGKTDYRRVDEVGLFQYLKHNSPMLQDGACPTTLYGGLDTETDAGKMWCITLSVKPGTGVMIRADDAAAVQCLRDYQHRFHWFIHNASFDVDKLLYAQHPVTLTHYSCTQQAVYHRGNLAQGLKVLGYRLFGVEMTSYEDVVLPHSRAKLMDWWIDALLLTGGEQVEVPGKISLKTGKQGKGRLKNSKLYSRLLYIYNHAQGSPEYDPWKQWDALEGTKGVERGDRKRVEEAVGAPPQPSIIWVPESQQISYACLDADIGLRLGLYLRKDERGFRKRAGFKR